MTNQNVPLINTKYFKTILITNCIMFFKHEIWQNCQNALISTVDGKYWKHPT